jgi:hypothetical protein
MRIIILDIDGVLNSIIYYEINPTNNSFLVKDAKDLDKHNLDLLKALVERTSAKIIISSTWRKDRHFLEDGLTDEEKMSKFKNLFAEKGWLDAPIIGFTPDLGTIRGHEVAVCLDNVQVDDYVIFDDDSDFLLGNLKDQTPGMLDRIGIRSVEDINSKSQYWNNQKLVLTNKLVGLSVENIVEVLKRWSPEDELVKTCNDYMKDYGKIFKLNAQ